MTGWFGMRFVAAQRHLSVYYALKCVLKRYGRLITVLSMLSLAAGCPVLSQTCYTFHILFVFATVANSTNLLIYWIAYCWLKLVFINRLFVIKFQQSANNVNWGYCFMKHIIKRFLLFLYFWHSLYVHASPPHRLRLQVRNTVKLLLNSLHWSIMIQSWMNYLKMQLIRRLRK